MREHLEINVAIYTLIYRKGKDTYDKPLESAEYGPYTSWAGVNRVLKKLISQKEKEGWRVVYANDIYSDVKMRNPELKKIMIDYYTRRKDALLDSLPDRIMRKVVRSLVPQIREVDRAIQNGN